MGAQPVARGALGKLLIPILRLRWLHRRLLNLHRCWLAAVWILVSLLACDLFVH